MQFLTLYTARYRFIYYQFEQRCKGFWSNTNKHLCFNISLNTGTETCQHLWPGSLAQKNSVYEEEREAWRHTVPINIIHMLAAASTCSGSGPLNQQHVCNMLPVTQCWLACRDILNEKKSFNPFPSEAR